MTFWTRPGGSREPANLCRSRRLCPGYHLAERIGKTLDRRRSAWPSLGIDEQDAAMARMPGENREVANIFGNQAPSIADGGIQHGFIRAPSKVGRPRYRENIVSLTAKHFGQGRRVHLVQH
jgi:hypothetical protein